MLITAIVIVHDLFERDEDEEDDRDEGQPDLDDDDCLSAEAVEIFDRYGVEVDSFEEIKDYQVERTDADELHDLRRRFTLRMAKIRSAPLTEAREAAAATSGVAGEIDF
jgi:serine/threonine protein kinase HipA of HipAB toxin-antitoxin module